jgi:hypothetical protein
MCKRAKACESIEIAITIARASFPQASADSSFAALPRVFDLNQIHCRAPQTIVDEIP